MWAVACRSFEIHDDRTASIEGAGVNQVWVESLPSDVSLPVLFNLGLLENEEAELQIELLAPDMLMLGTLDTTFVAEPRTDHRPGDVVTMIEAIILSFRAEVAGNYSAEVYADGRPLKSIFWVVKEGTPGTN